MRRILITFMFILMLSLAFTGVSYAAGEDEQQEEKQQVELTLDDAIERALIKSTTLEQAELDEERAWEVRKASRGGYIRGAQAAHMTGDLYVSVPGVDDAFFQFLSADAQWTINQKMLDITEDAIRLQAKNNYYDIIQKQQSVKAARANLEKAQKDYRSAVARASVGMATSVEVQGAKTNVEQKASALEQAQADLEKAYRALNKLIGLNPEDRPELVTQLEFEKLEVPSLENKIATALSSDNNPYMWIMEEKYDMSKYTWTFSQVDEAGLIDKEKANLTYQDAQKDMRNKVHELYESLKTLEASYESAKQGLATEENALAVTRVMYEVGMATMSDVLEKEAAVEAAKEGLLKIKSMYALTAETFEKPWLAMTGGASGSTQSGAAGSSGQSV